MCLYCTLCLVSYGIYETCQRLIFVTTGLGMVISIGGVFGVNIQF